MWHIKLKTASPKDYPFIRDLTRANMESYITWNEVLFKASFQPKRIKLIYTAGHKIGFYDFEKDRRYLHNIQIKKGYQNRGIGSFIMNKLMEKYKHINLKVQKNNKQALDFYKQFGKEVKIIK